MKAEGENKLEDGSPRASEGTEQLYRAIFMASRSALVATDLAGRIIATNLLFNKMTGWTNAEISGQPLLDLLKFGTEFGTEFGAAPAIEFSTFTRDGGSFPIFGRNAELIVSSRRTLPVTFSWEWLRSDGDLPLGTVLQLEVQAAQSPSASELLADLGNERVPHIATPRPTDASSSREERLEQIVGTVPLGWAELELSFDDSGDVRDLQVVDVNRTFLELVGRPAAQSIGVNQALPEVLKAVPGLQKMCGIVARTAEKRVLDVHMGGSAQWIRLTIFRRSAYRVISVLKDVTERRLAVEQSAAHWSSLLEAQALARIGNWEWNISDNRITGTPEFYHLFEAGQEEISSLEQFFALLHPEDRERIQREVTAAVEHKKAYETSYRVRMRVGGWRRMGAKGQVSSDGNGRPVSLIGTCQDITEQHEAVARLRGLNENLARSIRELEQFAYVASHDLQEPLRMVASYAQLLSQRYAGCLDERADKYISYIVDGAHRLQGLIRDLLLISSIDAQSSPPVPVDCGEVVRSVLHELEGIVVNSGATVHLGPLPTILAERIHIIQVFRNLISNAIKFRADAPLRVEIGAELKGDFWRISVSDNGIGIAQEYQEAIFLIFKRLHRRDQYPGNGVGLALAKKIVERYGGALTVESAPDRGACFTFTMPAVPTVQGAHNV